MKCLRKYKWVKLPRMHLPGGKGLMGYWAKLASRAAFRKGNAVYCGHINPVTAGMWSGGVVGLKSILGVKKRVKALWIINQLQDLGYISYSLDPKLIDFCEEFAFVDMEQIYMMGVSRCGMMTYMAVREDSMGKHRNRSK